MNKKKPLKTKTETAPVVAKPSVKPAVAAAPVTTPTKPKAAKAPAAPVLKADAPKAAKVPKPSLAFELEAPQASTVLLAGDFTGWDARPIALNKEGNGRWKASVTLAPGTYQYRFIVDGTWMDDPAAKARETNPFGTTNCVIQVSAN